MEPTWSRDSIFSLIEKIKEHPVLWNFKVSGFNKRHLKMQKAQEVCDQLKEEFPHHLPMLTADALLKKFSNLRTYFQREIKKIKAAPSGSVGPLSKWEFLDVLYFLKPLDEPVSTMQKPLDETLCSGQKSFDETFSTGQKLFDEALATGQKLLDETVYLGQKPHDDKSVDEALSASKANYLSQDPIQTPPMKKRKIEDSLMDMYGNRVTQINNIMPSGQEKRRDQTQSRRLGDIVTNMCEPLPVSKQLEITYDVIDYINQWIRKDGCLRNIFENGSNA